MTIQNPPIFIQAGSHPAEDVRRWIESLITGEGVLSSTEFLVAEAGTPDMTVDVSGGGVYIAGTEGTYQGMYYAENRGTTNVAVAASDPTNPRIDLVVARIKDAAYSGADNTFSIEVVTGTPAGTPAQPATPDNSLLLATISVVALASSITDAVITDTRTVAQGRGAPDGSSAAPSISFVDDPDSGVYLHGTDRVGIATGGAYRLIVDSGGIIINGAVEPGSGSAAVAAFAFNGDPDTGMYRAATNQLGFTAGGVQTMLTKSSQTTVNATAQQAFVVNTTHASNAYLQFQTSGSNTGYVGHIGSPLYITNSLAGGVYRMPQMDTLTTASAANVFFNSANDSMYVSTSSLRFKHDVETLTLESARKALDMRPIWYRSSGDDPKDWSFYGLGAEEVAEIDPRLVEFEPTPDCECSPDKVRYEEIDGGEPIKVDDRNLDDHSVECLRPRNVQYSRLVPHLITICQDQEARIEALEARLNAAGI